MLLALDTHLKKLASQENGMKTKKKPSPKYGDYFKGEISIGNRDPKMIVQGRMWEGGRGSRGGKSPAPQKRHQLLLDEYLENRLEKGAHSKLNSQPIFNRSLPKKGRWLLLDEYFDDCLEKAAHSKIIPYHCLI